MKNYIIIFFLLLFPQTIKSEESDIPPPISQYEWEMIHPQKRYGACWQFCKDDIKYTNLIINNLFNKVWEQEKQIRKLLIQISLYENKISIPQPEEILEKYNEDSMEGN